jgi:glutamate synthase domain-containing protein 1
MQGAAYPSDASSSAFIGHTRFATASLPAVRETHPHEWTPFAPQSVWSFADGKLNHETRTGGIWLSHNGDLDAVRLFGRCVDGNAAST